MCMLGKDLNSFRVSTYEQISVLHYFLYTLYNDFTTVPAGTTGTQGAQLCLKLSLHTRGSESFLLPAPLDYCLFVVYSIWWRVFQFGGDNVGLDGVLRSWIVGEGFNYRRSHQLLVKTTDLPERTGLLWEPSAEIQDQSLVPERYWCRRRFHPYFLRRGGALQPRVRSCQALFKCLDKVGEIPWEIRYM